MAKMYKTIPLDGISQRRTQDNHTLTKSHEADLEVAIQDPLIEKVDRFFSTNELSSMYKLIKDQAADCTR
jgi:hypothetical protein